MKDEEIGAELDRLIAAEPWDAAEAVAKLVEFIGGKVGGHVEIDSKRSLGQGRKAGAIHLRKTPQRRRHHRKK